MSLPLLPSPLIRVVRIVRCQCQVLHSPFVGLVGLADVSAIVPLPFSRIDRIVTSGSAMQPNSLLHSATAINLD